MKATAWEIIYTSDLLANLLIVEKDIKAILAVYSLWNIEN